MGAQARLKCQKDLIIIPKADIDRSFLPRADGGVVYLSGDLMFYGMPTWLRVNFVNKIKSLKIHSTKSSNAPQ